MDKLIRDSINIITPLDTYTEDLIYYWIIYAVLYLDIMRKGDSQVSKKFKDTYKLCEQLINSITTKKDIIFYRGVKNEHRDVIELNTITSITNKKKVAKDFGDVMKILVPKGSNAFFISAIDHIKKMKNIKNESEYETLILPGTLTRKKDMYIYKQN